MLCRRRGNRLRGSVRRSAKGPNGAAALGARAKGCSLTVAPVGGGTLGVRDMPGLGCVFTIDLPRLAASRTA